MGSQRVGHDLATEQQQQQQLTLPPVLLPAYSTTTVKYGLSVKKTTYWYDTIEAAMMNRWR